MLQRGVAATSIYLNPVIEMSRILLLREGRIRFGCPGAVIYQPLVVLRNPSDTMGRLEYQTTAESYAISTLRARLRRGALFQDLDLGGLGDYNLW
jgi:hypothetical protein